MKKRKLIVGIDISKNTLDVCFLLNPEIKQQHLLKVNNCKEGIQRIIKEVKKLKILLDETSVCFENTGVYGMHLCYYLQSIDVAYYQVPAIEIKRAKGLTRGKTDKSDAVDIANYAFTHAHKLKRTVLPEEHLIQLKLLLAEREKMIKSIAVFDTTKENEGFIPKKTLKAITTINQKTIKLLRSQLAVIDKEIKEIIQSNSIIKNQFDLATSVPGVGPQTAINLIVATRCFTAFDNWRKLACYAGVAPFEYSSGSSIRGKTKVSHLANKKLKSLLNMAALSAKKYDQQIKLYYERKTGEGKNGMLVMNAIRCKVLSRVFATIKRETPYVDFMKYSQ